MIRRDLRLASGDAGWALVSQVEHARISAQLAEQCTGPLTTPDVPASGDVRRQTLAAILHHDDGWAQWEQSPRIDQKLGRPVEFLELETAEAIAIWTRSIEAAATHGPLAGWIVAGHFSRLLAFSESARGDPAADSWQRTMADRRREWLAQWQASDRERNTAAVAAVAIEWLWTFDRASLWLCCDAPLVGEMGTRRSDFNPAGAQTPLEMHFSGVGKVAGANMAKAASSVRADVAASPWRFDCDALDVDAQALVVPVARYASPGELLAACQPATLRWRLRGGAAS